MPRDLSEVLHYFLPEADASTSGQSVDSPSPADPPPPRLGAKPKRESGRGPLSILLLPLAERDVGRAALTWGLVVETARLGMRAIMLTPDEDRGSPLWPVEGTGPFGSELIRRPAQDFASLYDAAASVSGRGSATGSATEDRPGIVFVRTPPDWLAEAPAAPPRPGWLLRLMAAGATDVDDFLEWSKRILALDPQASLGLTFFGAATIAQATRVQDALVTRAQQVLGVAPEPYGVVEEDLHLYRAIAAQRAVGLVYPQVPVTRGLQFVAKRLCAQARVRAGR